MLLYYLRHKIAISDHAPDEALHHISCRCGEEERGKGSRRCEPADGAPLEGQYGQSRWRPRQVGPTGLKPPLFLAEVFRLNFSSFDRDN
jgi:hypothetical protein